jgi:ABC-2 type transport system ATP-binding protein
VSQPLVVTKHLCKWYGKVVGINDFSLSIDPGVTGLLGPNGAGKTTLIKLIIGALRPSKGTLTVREQRPWRNQALLQRMGYCPEHDGIYADLSGTEFVTLMARLHGMDASEAEKRAKATLDRLGLAQASDRLMGTYSKGMRQRAKLAQALVHDPDLLLLDEPLTGCDPMARVQITEIIKELGQSKKTVIVSSHILHEIESMTSEIVLLHKGQVLAEGNIYRIREMIDEHPHKIQITCDDPRRLGQQLASSETVFALEFVDENNLVVETRDPDGCYPLIPRLALDHGIKIRELSSPDNNLQAVFDYLNRGRGPEGVAGATSGGAL